jgi:hypothetical protein
VNTCGQCKFWGSPKDNTETFKQCMAVIHDDRCLTDGNYDTDAWMSEDAILERDKIRTHAAVVQDGSGYRAALRCREDFGCVLFEEKPSPAQHEAELPVATDTKITTG